MSREDPQLKLRLTEEMKDELTQLARTNGRSMNAEIVHRLERSLQWDEDGQQEANEVIEALEAKLAEAVSVNEYLEKLKKELIERLESSDSNRAADARSSHDEPIFNIVLDAKGRPISWPEIAAHIHRTAKAAGIETASFRAAIFNADTQSRGDRDQEYAQLVRWYQQQTRKFKDQIREAE